MNKITSSSDATKLMELCVNSILEDNGVTLNDMTATDVVDSISMAQDLTFENITEAVEQWIEDTKQNYPEFLK